MDSERLERTKDAVRARLKTVCSHLSEAEFEKLVSQVAINELKLPTMGSETASRDREYPKR